MHEDDLVYAPVRCVPPARRLAVTPSKSPQKVPTRDADSVRPRGTAFMRYLRVVLLLGAAAMAGSPASFAQQAAVGPGTTPLDATGVTQGVNMSASAGTGTLTVGTVGGPQTDVFTNNS